jgi:Domain of unknown function (DUF4249)
MLYKNIKLVYLGKRIGVYFVDYLILLGILFSCKDKLVLISNQNLSPETVITGIANSGDSTVTVSISNLVLFNSQGISLDSLYIINANVSIRINKGKDINLKLDEKKLYKTKTILLPNDSVFLEVRIKNKMYFAKTQIPNKLKNINLTKLPKNRFELQCFSSIKNQIEYYQFANIYNPSFESLNISWKGEPKSNFAIKSKNEDFANIFGMFYDFNNPNSNFYEINKGKVIQFSILQMDFEYYNYLYGKNQGLIVDPESQIPTFKPEGNISNGVIGYFGSLNTTKFTIEI